MNRDEAAFDAETIRSLAARYGMDVDEETAGDYALEIEGSAALVDGLAVDAPAHDPATGVEPGDDPHDAVRYWFSLPAGAGKLSDLTMAVKDNMAVAGVPTTCGSGAFRVEPSCHATVVERLRVAGVDLVATTNMDEFAFFTTGETCAHGRPENPRLAGRVPGGSSAGSGGAVAAGLVDAALGTDTGGSVRIPASFCGVVGLKPTFGSVSRFGVVDLSPSLDHVGVLAESVGTAARVFEAMAGTDPSDPATRGRPTPEGVADAAGGGLDGLRVGVVGEAMEGSDPGVAGVVEDALGRLEAEGLTVERTSIPEFGDAAMATSLLSGAELAAVLEGGMAVGAPTAATDPWRSALSDLDLGECGENLREQVLTHATLTAAMDGTNYDRAMGVRRAVTRTVLDRLAEFDALVAPTTPTTAPAFGAVEDGATVLQTFTNTSPFNLTGHPALSVPCGWTDDGPVGLQVVAPYHDEATAVRVGAGVERTRPPDPDRE